VADDIRLHFRTTAMSQFAPYRTAEGYENIRYLP
jgi:hypothetical protein